MESVRGYDSDHPSSEGVCQAEPPTQAWSVHELQDTGIGGAPSDPATPEDPESPRRNQEGKEGNDKCPVRPQQAAARSSTVSFRNLFTQENQPPSEETLSILVTPIYKTH